MSNGILLEKEVILGLKYQRLCMSNKQKDILYFSKLSKGKTIGFTSFECTIISRIMSLTFMYAKDARKDTCHAPDSSNLNITVNIHGAILLQISWSGYLIQRVRILYQQWQIAHKKCSFLQFYIHLHCNYYSWIFIWIICLTYMDYYNHIFKEE